jgi:hypothetical protein
MTTTATLIGYATRERAAERARSSTTTPHVVELRSGHYVGAGDIIQGSDGRPDHMLYRARGTAI